MMDVVEYFEKMERIFNRGILIFPGEGYDLDLVKTKDKTPKEFDRNLGGRPWACRNCGTIYFPHAKVSVECPFCFAPQEQQSGPLLHSRPCFNPYRQRTAR